MPEIDSQAPVIRLPEPCLKGNLSLEEAITRRRSVRSFSTEAVTPAQLSRVLWAAQGITDMGRDLRAVPSAGATYPLEVYVVCGQDGVAGIGAGVYRYHPARHSLTLHLGGDFRADLARAALSQGCVARAPLTIVIGAYFTRTTRGYGQRGEMYVHIEVGHAGQNIYLQAAALGLATVAVGAFRDQAVREALHLEADCQPLYLMPLGKTA
ncbi:MAG: SagB/ThcOx family dehydrogenase [Dehalococcoidales bacterium]|nr:SagB/ThcOx family dehydrogenase [Dehalococcoidales bacterium]